MNKFELSKEFDKITQQAIDDITSANSVFQAKVLRGAIFLKAAQKLRKQKPEHITEKNWLAILENTARSKTRESTQNREESGLVKFRLPDNKKGYTTHKMIAEEAKIVSVGAKLANNGKNGISVEEREKAAESYNELTRFQFGCDAIPGHLTAIKNVLSAGDLKIIDGPPGSGKTSVLAGITSALSKTKGGVPPVFATGSTDKAASAMFADIVDATNEEDKSKIKGDNLDGIIKLMNAGKVPAGSLVVVDEAGMLGTSDMANLLEASEKSKAKLILMGDAKQLPPTAMGEPYRILTEYMKKNGQVEPSYLTQTLRQEAGDEKKASEAFRAGEALQALSIYDNKSYTDVSREDFEANVKNGKQATSMHSSKPLSFVDTEEDALSQTAQSYLRWCFEKPVTLEGADKFIENGKEPKPETAIAITVDRRSADKVNAEIREGLKSKGVVTNSQTIQTSEGAKEFGISEQVIFSEKVISASPQGKQTINAGTTGKVEGIFKDGSIAVRLDDKRIIKVAGEQANALNYAYCVDVRTSQGMSRDRAFVAIDKRVDLAEMMVAMTRHKQRVSVAIAKNIYSNIGFLAKDASKRRDKTNIVDVSPRTVLQHKLLKGASR